MGAFDNPRVYDNEDDQIQLNLDSCSISAYNYGQNGMALTIFYPKNKIGKLIEVLQKFSDNEDAEYYSDSEV
jgi:hypothetical protein